MWPFKKKPVPLQSEEFEILGRKFNKVVSDFDDLTLSVKRLTDRVDYIEERLTRKLKAIRNREEDLQESKPLNSPFSAFGDNGKSF